MGNYMSAEPPNIDWTILHNEIIQLGEDFEVSIGENAEACTNMQYERCTKNPGHTSMTLMSKFSLEDIPKPWRDPWLYEEIIKHSKFVVKINVGCVSARRPKKYFLSQFKGMKVKTGGSGFAYGIREVSHLPLIDCPIENCPKGAFSHKVTPIFKVQTACHVVYNSEEAKTSTVVFFYNSPEDDVAVAEVHSVEASDSQGDVCTLHCVSHDHSLFARVLNSPKGRSPVFSLLGTSARQATVQRSPLVVVISHPHSHVKHVSFGDWVGYGPPLPWVRNLKESAEEIRKPSNVEKDQTVSTSDPGNVNGATNKECDDDKSSGNFTQQKQPGEETSAAERAKNDADDDGGDILSTFKLSEFTRFLATTFPSIRENGCTFDGKSVSSETFRRMESSAKANPNISVGDFFSLRVPNMGAHTMSYLTYSTTTCPGSSGGPVFVFFDRKNEKPCCGMIGTHFRQFRKKRSPRQINQCGSVFQIPGYSEEVNRFKDFVQREK